MITNQNGRVGPAGDSRHALTRDLGTLTHAPASWKVRNLFTRRRELPKVAVMNFLGRIPGVVSMEASLGGRVYRMPTGLAPWQLLKLRELLAENVDVRTLLAPFGGQVTDYGVLSRRVVTTTGVNFIVDAFQNLVELENLKYHGYGTGGSAEAVGNTALTTELTTEYVTNNVRPTGTTTEGASANIYRTVATLSPDSGGTLAITEHGIFDQASNAGGTMLDRSLFSAVNLVASSDSLQTTYDLTVTAGG